MNENQRQMYIDGYHDRMRGIKRADAPRTLWLRAAWLDGWNEADGELYDRAISRAT